MHGDWHALGEVQYRKWAAYEPLNWDPNIRIDEYVVAGASYGGPIAMVRDHRRLMPLADADAPLAPPVLKLYSSAGTTLAEVIIMTIRCVAPVLSLSVSLVSSAADSVGE